MIAIVNHLDTRGVDLSMRIAGTWRRCRLLPASVNSLARTQPSVAYASQAHIDAINALDPSDPRLAAFIGFELVDLGELGPDEQYAGDKRAALDAALAPRKSVIIVGAVGYTGA